MVLQSAERSPEGVSRGRVLRADCEACSSQEWRLLERYSPHDWPLVACTACGFAYLRIVPDYSLLADTYAWEKTAAAESARRAKTRWGRFDVVTRWRTGIGRRLDRSQIKRSLPASGRVLDIGCGPACRIPSGLTPFGVEVSKALADAARPVFEAQGGSVVNAPALVALRGFRDGFFSAILMRSYLEHESQPYEVLEEAFRCLAPGGKVFVRVPNFASLNRLVTGRAWCGFRFPDHVNYFSGASLRRLSARVGFRYFRLNWLSLLDDNLIVILTKPQVQTPERA
jgi:SAM-dependent methyltransferase